MLRPESLGSGSSAATRKQTLVAFTSLALERLTVSKFQPALDDCGAGTQRGDGPQQSFQASADLLSRGLCVLHALPKRGLHLLQEVFHTGSQPQGRVCGCVGGLGVDSSAGLPHTPLAGIGKPFLEDTGSNQGLGKVCFSSLSESLLSVL